MYLAPHGPGSSNWTFLGFSKHQVKNIHIALGLVALTLIVIHGFLNLGAVKSYLKPTTPHWQHPLAIAVLVLALTIVAAVT